MTSIAAERLLLLAAGLQLRWRSEWGAVFDYSTRRDVTEPAVAGFNHISVTDPDNYPSNDAHMQAIERIGIARFPATGISYNGAVLPGGQLYEGQPWGRRGAHTVNTYQLTACETPGCPGLGTSVTAPSWNNNINGRALVFARNINDPITDGDVDAAARYWAAHKIAGLMTRGARLHGHWCVTAKGCPGRRVWERIDDIADATATYVRTGLPDHNPEATMPGPSMLIQKGASVVVAVLHDGRVLSLTNTGGQLLSDVYDVPIVRGMPLVDIQLIQSSPVNTEGPGPVGGVRAQTLEEESDTALGIDQPAGLQDVQDTEGRL